jgi:hypothetical protein
MYFRTNVSEQYVVSVMSVVDVSGTRSRWNTTRRHNSPEDTNNLHDNLKRLLIVIEFIDK